MKMLRAFNVLCIAAGLATTAPAIAAPLNPSPAYDANLVVQVRGCHRDVERHYVPEFGRPAWHYHRPNCRPVQVPPPGAGVGVRDCHRDVRRHFVPGYGRVTHRHVGPNCRVRVYSQFNPGRPRPANCIQIGPVRYCEY
ncbi:hypothetical protein SAMN04488498_10698 [Mesorhizobium albiziae]|uniref:Secreted protein n=1 Tax=Neomesorhizobium albiziae TaxID=335020 RepID=A0A1I3ZD60_9HYPH|nr:hypothetical protein [Mesorhizobium albiziae]GLS32154.1 hypothetical protein GCM10007937_38640 [Mesorhizobium albiziae]SFK41840.1 hypothetical protein SAMN04488498_10698 [Mesorhizobium albiziae]